MVGCALPLTYAHQQAGITAAGEIQGRIGREAVCQSFEYCFDVEWRLTLGGQNHLSNQCS